MNSFFILTVVSLTLAAPAAAAACRWEHFCNGDGACKQMPLCDSIHEKPPPRPDTRPPAMPPIAMKPYRVPGPMGTLTCEHLMRQESSGKWKWIEMCYCTDPSRSTDPTPPFAHIVRCESRE